MRDIQQREDVQQVVSAFYEQLLTDPVIGFFFTEVTTLDLGTHIPTITDFWTFQLLGEKNYHGNVFEVHQQLHRRAALTPDHFHRWVHVLHNTIDQHYAGPTADAMKLKAAMIARKMAQVLANGYPASPGLPGVQHSDPVTER